MKNNLLPRYVPSAMVIILMFLSAGCSDLFVNPLKDKTTGENIPLLLVDRNFIKTKLYFHLIDDATDEPISSEPVDLIFLRADSANLISFSGQKKSVYTTSSGFLEIDYDPNVVVNDANPIELSLICKSEHYTSVPQYFNFTATGDRHILIRLSRMGLTDPGPKHGFNEPFDLKFNNVPRSPDLDCVWWGTQGCTEDPYIYWNQYLTKASGEVLCNNLRDSLLYAVYGVYWYYYERVTNTYHSILYPDVPTKRKQLPANAQIFPAVRKNLRSCPNGLIIQIDGCEGNSTYFKYRLDFADGSFKEGWVTCLDSKYNSTGTFWYPTNYPTVKVTVFSSYTIFMSDPVTITDPCNKIARFTALRRPTDKLYTFNTRFLCPGQSVAYTLTSYGQYRTVSPPGLWTGCDMKQGIVSLSLQPDVDYEFRISIDGIWHNFILPTDPARIESALRDNQGADYTLDGLTIDTSFPTQVNVRANIRFSTAICNLFHW